MTMCGLFGFPRICHTVSLQRGNQAVLHGGRCTAGDARSEWHHRRRGAHLRYGRPVAEASDARRADHAARLHEVHTGRRVGDFIFFFLN